MSLSADAQMQAPLKRYGMLGLTASRTQSSYQKLSQFFEVERSRRCQLSAIELSRK